MVPDVLVRKLLAQREFWHDLGNGLRVKLRRPSEVETMDLLRRDASGSVSGLFVGPDVVKRCAVDWEGVKECDLIVSGASDVVAFDAALWGAVVDDRREWCNGCAAALIDAIVRHESDKVAAKGN